MPKRSRNIYWLALLVIILVLYYRPASNFVYLNYVQYQCRATVASYLEALVVAHREGKPELISPYVNDKELTRTATEIRTDRKNKKVLISEMEGFSSEDFYRSGKDILFVTHETWNYKYVSTDTGKDIAPLKRKRYNVQYTLNQSDKKFTIMHVWVQNERLLRSERAKP